MNDYLAGTVSGMLESIITYPGDTIKTRLQSGQTFRSVIRPSGIYSGFALKVLTTPITRSLFWGIKSHTSKTCDNEYITSSLAGLTQSVLDAPVDKYKIHRQLGLSHTEAVRIALRKYAISYLVTATRNVPFATVYYHLSGRIESGSNAVDRACAASTAALITHPLDTIKTVIQSENSLTTIGGVRDLMRGAMVRSSVTALNLVIGHYMFDLLRIDE